MNKVLTSSLAMVLVAGCLQAQDPSIQTELANQRARIAELEKKFAAKPDSGPLQFPREIKPYVLIDATIVQTSNATAAGQSKVDFASPWFAGDRWGLRGTLDTNVQDLSMIYKLENGFVSGDGSNKTTNVLFDRDAWAGFYSKTLGQFTFGRQNTLARDFSGNYCDTYGPVAMSYEESGWANQNNFKDMISFASSVDGARINKGMVWKKITNFGLTMGAAYNFSYYTLNTSITPANKAAEAFTSTRDTTASVAVGYNGKGYNLSSFYTLANNAGFTQRSYSAGGNVEPIKQLRVNGGFFHYSADQGPANPRRTDTAFTVSAAYTAALVWTFSLGYQGWKAEHGAMSGTGTAAVMTLPFTNGSAATSTGSGARNTTYGGIMRSMNRWADVYAVFDYEQLTDLFKLAATNGFHSQTEFALGLKLRTN